MVHPFSLDHETAVITGGGSGLGMARCFRQAGARVILVGRRREELAKACDELGEHAFFVVQNITDLDGIEAAFKEFVSLHGPPTILINNAGTPSLNDLLAGPMKQSIPDPYAQCPELDDWVLYAVGGHYHHAACFDKKSENSKGEVRAMATGQFFRMNMRNHHMSCLGMANPEDGKKKAHDITVIKRSSAEQLRNGAPKGRKVMLIWDKACIDYRHWFKLKQDLWHLLRHAGKIQQRRRNLFHQFKSKMGERKSWASSLEAKQSHAIIECLTHNLLLLFEQHLGHSEGLRDEFEEKKQQGRAKGTAVASLAAGIIRAAGNFINTALARATQRTQRFIRWVRVWIYKQAPWRDSIDRLREVWATTSA